MTTPTGLEPTQTRRPWRATLRTILQVGLPAVLGLPLVFTIVVEELGPNLPPSITAWLIAAGAVITAVAAALARIMAIPGVELALRRLPAAAFAAQPLPKPVDEPAASVVDLDENHPVVDATKPCLRTNGVHCQRHDAFHSGGPVVNRDERGAISRDAALFLVAVGLVVLIVLAATGRIAS